MAVLRGIGGVIAGYIVMVIIISVGFLLLWNVLGVAKVFEANSWTVSNTWVFAGMCLGLVAALVGGIVCKLIANSGTAGMVLAGIILVVGLAFAALGSITVPTPDTSSTPIAVGEDDPNAVVKAAPPTAAPAADVSMFDAAQYAEEPPLSKWSNPIIGCLGVLVGSSLVGRKKR
jgi:hypothetical protein